MRSRPLPILALLGLAASPLLFCDSVETGQIPEDPGPPVLMKILIQDRNPPSLLGRQTATDLLDERPPIKCSDREPCPAGEAYGHPPCNMKAGVCPNPYQLTETPVLVGVGGTQVRFVFNKRLDPALSKPKVDDKGKRTGSELVDPSLISVHDAAGKELSFIDKFFDPTGNPTETSDPFVNPFGPALVVRLDALQPLSKYSVRLKAAGAKDAKGQVLAKDVNGKPIAEQYEFTTEGLHSAGGALDDLDGTLDPRDALIMKTSLEFQPGSLKVTAKIQREGGVTEEVGVRAFPFNPMAPACCDPSSPLQFIVFRYQDGDNVPWEVGDYLLTVQAIAKGASGAIFAADPFNKEPHKDQPFKVRVADPADQSKHDPFQNLWIKPWGCKKCEAPSAADMSKPADGGI